MNKIFFAIWVLIDWKNCCDKMYRGSIVFLSCLNFKSFIVIFWKIILRMRNLYIGYPKYLICIIYHLFFFLKVIELAATSNKKVRVIGAGQSPSDVCCTNDFMISFKKFNDVLEVEFLLSLMYVFVLEYEKSLYCIPSHFSWLMTVFSGIT